MKTAKSMSEKDILLSLVFLIGALVFPSFSDNLVLEDCPSGQLTWKTYKSVGMQLSFAYPASWRVFPEKSTGLGVGISIKAKTLFVGIQRLNDKAESKKTHEKLFYGQKKHENSSEESIVIKKDTCTEIRFMVGAEERVSIYWPEKRLEINFTYTSPNQMVACSSIINQVLSSFEFSGEAASSAKSKSLADYANGSLEWKTYSSPELFVSFSYPAFWTIDPEHSEYGGLALRLNSIEDSSTIGLVVRRWSDTTGTAKSFHSFFAEANRQIPGEVDYNRKDFSLSNNNCTKVSYRKTYLRQNMEETTTSVYCPQKKLIITFYYSSKAESAYGSIVNKILSSFSVDNGGVK